MIGSENSWDNIYHNDDEDAWTNWDWPSGDNCDGDCNDNPPIENGKLNDWKGWNYRNYDNNNPPNVFEDNNVIPEQLNEDLSAHGIAISGIIAAKTNNNDYMAGIAGGNLEENIEGVKILPLKMSDWREDPNNPGNWIIEFSSEKVDDAIYYATEIGAQIIVMCFKINGGSGLQESIENALEYAYNQNVVLVAAAGNEGYEYTIPFPANNEYVIAVGATDQADNQAKFPMICQDCASNCGPEMDLCAPGKEILTLTNYYSDDWEGTSMSAPMVAATAALMLSVNPDISNEDIETILKNTAEKVGEFPYVDDWNCSHGFGRINTYAAVCEALEYMLPITINSNTLWDYTVVSLHDVTVESESVLTITSTVYMGPDARIIIEPGAEIIINGGTITDFQLCGNENVSWPGIEVWGNKFASQYTEGAQGKLILRNGATIENAVTAVELWQPGVDNSTGGIIDAIDAIFLNNARSIHAKDYKNFNPYVPT